MQPETPSGLLAADDARQRGNALYKQGNLAQAESSYLEASGLAPQDARPLSNLAAVYFELAKYAKCAEACRKSLNLLGEDSQEPLADKTRIRLVKSLVFSNKPKEAHAVLSSVVSEESRNILRSSLSRMLLPPNPQQDQAEIRGKLIGSVARYRPSLQDIAEYYSVGHDDADTLLPNALLSTTSKEIACLCCGIGDARNLLATIFYLGISRSRKAFHFTIVDLKPAVFARDLLIFRLLFDAQAESEARKTETTVTLSYLFGAQIMPKWVFNRLQVCISAVITDLKKTSQNPMGIFYIPEPTRERIMYVLLQWQQPPQPWYAARALRCAARDQHMARELSQRGRFDDMEAPRAPPGCDQRSHDVMVYREIYAVLPPVHLLKNHEPQFLKKFEAYTKSRTSKDRKAVEDYLDTVWQPNVTLVDLDFETKREDGHDPSVEFTPHEVVSTLFGAIPPEIAGCSPGVINHFCGFFSLVGGMLNQMSKSQLVVEVILDEMTSTLERLRYGILRKDQKPIKKLDPQKFPDRYDSIDLSNIPDYVGGALTTFLYGVPLLREQGVSRIRSYVLRNPGIWLSHDQFLAEYLLLADRHQIKSHFRTALKPQSVQIEQNLSGKLFGGGGGVMALGFEWERSAPLAAPLTTSARMPRADLEYWLHAHFFKLCLPFPRERHGLNLVIAPLNMSAFFHLVAHILTLGYPPHWLAGTLTTLCSGILARTRAGPPIAIVTDQKLAVKTWPPADVCVAPFAAEFRTLLALWEPVLGVPIVFDSDKGYVPRLPERTAIRKFAIQFPSLNSANGPWHNPFFLLVLKAKSLKAGGDRLRRLLDGRAGDMSSTAQAARSKPLVHAVSAFTWVTETRTASFWMDEAVLEIMLSEGGWEAWIWRTDTWDPAVGPVSLDRDGVLVKKESWC